MNANFRLYHRIELAFWDFAIQTLTENIHVRRIVRYVGRQLRGVSLAALLRRTVTSALIGLTAGVLLFFLSLYSG